MLIDKIEDLDQFFEVLISNQDIYSELNKWGKVVRLILDEREFLLDFSQSPQNIIVESNKTEKIINFTVKSKFEVLKDILIKKIDPVESYAQGFVEIDGSIMELMEFAEILIDRIFLGN
jgi:putative sterol carrier protein